MSRFELELACELKLFSVAFGLAARSFFLSPAINFFPLESQKVTHAGMGQGMFIIGALRPLHNSCGRGLPLRI